MIKYKVVDDEGIVVGHEKIDDKVCKICARNSQRRYRNAKAN